MGQQMGQWYEFLKEITVTNYKYRVLLLLLCLSAMFSNSLQAMEQDQQIQIKEGFVYDLKEAEKLAKNETRPDEFTHKLLYADRLFHLRHFDAKYRNDALEWYQKIFTASKEKYPAVLYRLAILFDEMSDLKKANFYMEEAKNLNDRAAKCKIGMYYILGQHGYQKNPERGLALLKDAAESNSFEAMETLGMLYANGILVPYDMDKALFWFQKMNEEKIIQSNLFLSNLTNLNNGKEQ